MASQPPPDEYDHREEGLSLFEWPLSDEARHMGAGELLDSLIDAIRQLNADPQWDRTLHVEDQARLPKERNQEMTDEITLEERLAKELAGRLLGCTDDIAGEDEEDDETLAELEHMRDVADKAYAALSDLALHCHNRREDVAWGIARRAAEDAHALATFVGDWIEDMEDED